MDTRERILQTALELYNAQGINTITSRHIAAEMGISPGNLHYHFKQTDELIRQLYDRLKTSYDGIMEGLGAAQTGSLSAISDYLNQSFELSWQYRFIFLHFVEISLRIPAIRKEYATLTRRREKEFMAIFEKWQAGGLFRPDLPPGILQSLVTQIFIVADFWLSNNELTLQLKGAKAIRHYSRIFTDMLYPWLTASAQQMLTISRQDLPGQGI